MNRMVTDKHIAKVAKESFNMLDHGYNGTTEPSASLGKDGELYIQTGATNYLWIKINGTWLKLG